MHDLWPLSPKELGGLPVWHPFILWMQRAENYAYKHVDGVISMLPKTKEHMRAHGLDLNKWNYIPNGIQIEDWQSAQPLNKEVERQINEIRARSENQTPYRRS